MNTGLNLGFRGKEVVVGAGMVVAGVVGTSDGFFVVSSWLLCVSLAVVVSLVVGSFVVASSVGSEAF